MRRTIPPATLCLACFFFLCNARQASAQPQSPDGTVYYCASSWDNRVVYFSAPFETDEIVRTNIQEAYSQFLKQKYSYAGGASNIVCSISESLTSAQSDKGDDEASAKRASHSVMETGWKYRGATAIASAATSNRSASPAASHAAPAPARPPVSTPLPAASAAPTANTAPSTVAAAGGGLTSLNFCFSNQAPNPSDANYKTMYFSAPFETNVETGGAIPVLEPAFSTYLQATYHTTAGITCRQLWTVADGQALQKEVAGYRAKLKVIDTGWRYGQPALGQGQNGPDLPQHRVTTYYCTWIAAGGATMATSAATNGFLNQTRYVSPVFQADWDADAVSKAWIVYIRDNYVHDIDMTNLANDTGQCATEGRPSLLAMMHQGMLRVDRVGRHVVAVDWKYSPTQAAASMAAVAAETAASQAPTAAANQNYVWCNSAWAGVAGTVMPSGTVMYFSDVFAAVMPPPPAGATRGNGWAQRNATAAFQTPYFAFLQKKYGYKDSSNYPVDCRVGYSPTVAGLQSAQRAKQQFEDMAKQNRAQIVETGWKNQ